MIVRPVLLAAIAASLGTSLAHARVTAPHDWSTGGGDNGHSGLSAEVGPSSPTVLWNVPSFGVTGTPVFTAGSRVFRVGSHALTTSSPSMLECHDLDTGALAWSVFVPYESSAHAFGGCFGVDHERVYTSRGEKIRAYDVATGALLWTSVDSFAVDYWEDAVFTPDGDLIVDTLDAVHRVRGSDGTTTWTHVRPSLVSGGQGVALRGSAIYAHESSASGSTIVKLDLATGSFAATSGLLSVGETRNTPFTGADGMVYAAYSSAAPGVLVALHDDGDALSTRWTAPTAVTSATNLRYAVGPDGSVLHVAPGLFVQRLAGSTGGSIAQSAPIPTLGSYGDFRLIVDARGSVYVTNGGYSTYGRILALDRNLAPSWSATVNEVAFGGPALGRSGTLLVSGANGLTAYRIERTPARSYCAGDGSASACPCTAGYTGNGCANSVQASGARLVTDGVASVASDTLTLHAFAMPDSVSLFAQGTSRRNGGQGAVFGDGLACLDGTIVRLGQRSNVDGAAIYPAAGDAPISIRGQIPAIAGVTRTYQVSYRNAAAYCATATFNLTNGVELLWEP